MELASVNLGTKKGDQISLIPLAHVRHSLASLDRYGETASVRKHPRYKIPQSMSQDIT